MNYVSSFYGNYAWFKLWSIEILFPSFSTVIFPLFIFTFSTFLHLLIFKSIYLFLFQSKEQNKTENDCKCSFIYLFVYVINWFDNLICITMLKFPSFWFFFYCCLRPVNHSFYLDIFSFFYYDFYLFIFANQLNYDFCGMLIHF